jgi:hypothetical protein
MSKTPKVVAIKESRYRLVAEDERTSRFILGVGKHRIAFDFTTLVTRLPDGTGDQPARVLPIENKKGQSAPNTSVAVLDQSKEP